MPSLFVGATLLSVLNSMRLVRYPLPLVSLFFAATLAAQSTGPLTPPPASGPAPSAPGAIKSRPVARKVEEAPITKEPPSLPTDQIIQKFAAKEETLKQF